MCLTHALWMSFNDLSFLANHIKLTGKVAAWAVCKQKSHRSISQTAMMHLNTIVNP